MPWFVLLILVCFIYLEANQVVSELMGIITSIN